MKDDGAFHADDPDNPQCKMDGCMERSAVLWGELFLCEMHANLAWNQFKRIMTEKDFAGIYPPEFNESVNRRLDSSDE